MQPAANTTWFTLTLNGRADFAVYSFSGTEATSHAFAFTVEMVHLSSSIPVRDFLGKEACLSIADKSGTPRLVNGIVSAMRQLHTANMRTHYQCTLVPRLAFLQQNNDHRIFQNKSVIQIISQILKEQGFAGDTFSFKCFYEYEPREYCTQYNESDFHFINRLCEEEGIYYYFEHLQDKHCLTFCDRESGPPITGKSLLRFFPGSGQQADFPVISRLNLHKAVRSNAASFREWNFQKPKLNLGVGKSEGDNCKAPTPSGMSLETYRYPHLYELQKTGKRYAELQLLRQLTKSLWLEGESDVARLTPGYTFQVEQHPRTELNDLWTLTRVSHFGEQPQVLEHEAPDRGMTYRATFTAIPERTRFMPETRHPKTLIEGKQTAIVTGPPGEEIYPDKYGRVKVQFFWDRADLWNENTTCWIRASQGWAGTLYGTMELPRIGHEVIVSFLEGNPDRPIITGRTYHALNMPPYNLPEHKTRTVFKSMSTPGAENETRGFNELRIEDKKGQEEIYSHAQKDLNIHVKNDWKSSILHDRHQTVDNFSYTKIKKEVHGKVEAHRKTLIKPEDHLTVRGQQHTQINGRWLVKTGEEIHLESLMKAVVEAGADLTLKVGPSFVRMVGGDIYIVGPRVDINGAGAAGEGTPAEPLLPEGAKAPAVPPRLKIGCLREAARKHNPVVGEAE